MLTIPQSTAWNAPLQAYLSSDHVTAATGKTIAITLSKNGGAYANPSGGATNATEIANGSYYVALSITDTSTLGPLFVRGAVSGVDDVILILNVVKATNGGLTALPDTAITTNASLLTSGTGTAQIANTGGAVTIETNNDKTGYTASTVSDKTGYTLTNAGYAAVMTQQLTESYAAKGTVPTPAQLMLEVRALLAENAVASTTVTTKKIDGSTSAHTYTLDSSTAPTTITTAS